MEYRQQKWEQRSLPKTAARQWSKRRRANCAYMFRLRATLMLRDTLG